MPTWRKKPPNDHNVNKRSTAEQRAVLADAAQAATARIYADVLDFWQICLRKKCCTAVDSRVRFDRFAAGRIIKRIF
jgi:hypothetical protein